MRGWRDRRGAGVEIRQTARAIRAQNVRPHARGEGATAGATARASWVRVYQRGLWGLGRAWALGAWRLGGLGAWALGGLGEDEPPGAGFPGVGLHRRRLHGGSFRAGFPGASGGLPAGFTGLSLGAFPGAFPGLFRGLRRAFPAGFPGGLSRGFSGGLFRRAFPADARLGRADSSFLNSPPCAGATKRRRVLLRGGESDFGVPA